MVYGIVWYNMCCNCVRRTDRENGNAGRIWLYQHVKRANLYTPTVSKLLNIRQGEGKERRRTTHQTQPQDHTTPKANIIQRLLAPDQLGLLQHHNRQLEHLANETIASQLLGDTGHNDLVAYGRDQKGNDGRVGLADMRPAGAVYVSPQEIVYGHVPLAGKFHPVRAVPPVRVEVAIGKVRDLSEGAEDILEDDEEDEQEGEHEGEQQPGDGLRQNEEAFERRQRTGIAGGGAQRRIETDGGVGQRGQDELLRDDGQQKDAAEDGQDLGQQVLPVDGGGARVLDFIA